MADYSLSQTAAADVDGIYEYTIINFGLDQARAYLSGMHGRMETLAEHPLVGRNADELAPGLRRFEYESHIIFYVVKTNGVHIVRVLHQSMDVRRHL